MKKELIETVDNVKMEVSVMTINRSVNQKSLIVTQANALARSVQEMTLQEKRLLLLAISHIRQSDDNFVLYRIPVTRIREYLGLDDGSYYSRINKITTNLLGRVIEVEKKNGDWEKFQWVSYCCYRSKGTSDMPEACLDIRMHDCLRPLLLNLQKYFGSVYLHQIAPIPGFNSMRVFELLYYSAMYSKKERKFKKTNISFEVIDFKKRLGMEGKYKDFKDFRKDVLNRAQKDCEVCSPLVFTWKEEKKGRKIVRLHFTIKLNKKFEDESVALLNQDDSQTASVNSCWYCDSNNMIYFRINDGAVLPKPCSHNEQEIIDFAISKEYNIENAKSSNNRFNAIKTEFENIRHQKVKEIVEAWNEDTKQAEMAKFLQTTDSLTRKLFHKKGLNHPATLAIFTLYMVKNNYLPPEFSSLKDWYFKNKPA